MQYMDRIDRAILNEIQLAFPLSSRPYNELALRVGIEESEVIDRIDRMKQSGVIRRIGGIFDSRKLGYYSTLCATKIPIEKINEVAESVNRLPGVTHNYLREHDWNMWFTLTAESKENAEESIRALEKNLDIKIISMPSKKVYKIKVAFDMGEGEKCEK